MTRALPPSVILLVGSTLVIIENVPKVFAPEKVNYDGMLVLGIFAIIVNLAASKVVWFSLAWSAAARPAAIFLLRSSSAAVMGGQMNLAVNHQSARKMKH